MAVQWIAREIHLTPLAHERTEGRTGRTDPACESIELTGITLIHLGESPQQPHSP